MFDFGFSKLLLIGIVALVVIGPERLPRVARTLGHLYGRLQRYVTQVKADIHREMEAADLGNVKTEFENAARSFQTEMQSNVNDVEREMREAQATIERSLDTSALAANEPSVPAAAGTTDSPEVSPQLELGIDEPRPEGVPRDKAAR